jgi:ankyrin repeat protein
MRKEMAMAVAALPQDPDLDQLRTQARDLQRAVRAGDAEAAARVAPYGVNESPEQFRLTTAQLVLAREHGFASWDRLRRYVRIVTAGSWSPGPAKTDESPADRFLRLACLTGGDDERADAVAAAALLADHPTLVDQSVHVAAACADVTALRRHLASGRKAATASGGPHGWSPLLYQAYARHDPLVDRTATLETADLLLGAGADPNDGRFWHALPTPWTVLTGVLGHGEQATPEHPHALAFARRLLDAGADPNDGQAIYNRMFASDDDHLVLLFEYGLGQPSQGPWYRLLGDSLESPQTMLRSLLAWAVAHDQRERVRLLAGHGVDVVSPFTELRSPRRRTPVEFALVSGHREVAELLRSLGAEAPQLSAGDTFVAAVLAGDEAAVAGTPARTVASVRRRRPGLVTWAAAQGAANSVALLVRSGFDVNAFGRSDVPSNMPWRSALHVAAETGNLDLARTLLDLGADPNAIDKNYRSTPLGWAQFFDRPDMVALLEPVTRPDETPLPASPE